MAFIRPSELEKNHVSAAATQRRCPSLTILKLFRTICDVIHSHPVIDVFITFVFFLRLCRCFTAVFYSAVVNLSEQQVNGGHFVPSINMNKEIPLTHPGRCMGHLQAFLVNHWPISVLSVAKNSRL